MRCLSLSLLFVALFLAGCGDTGSSGTGGSGTTGGGIGGGGTGGGGAPSDDAVQRAKKLLAAGETIPFDFELPDPDGKIVKLADYKGKVLIVDLWGTWCPPCRDEVPHFVELHKKYKNKGLEIVGVNLEQVEPAEIPSTIKEGIKELGITYTCVVGDDAIGRLADEGVPTTLFLDRTGKVRAKVVGYQKLDRLEAIVLELLNEKQDASLTPYVVAHP